MTTDTNLRLEAVRLSVQLEVSRQLKDNNRLLETAKDIYEFLTSDGKEGVDRSVRPAKGVNQKINPPSHALGSQEGVATPDKAEEPGTSATLQSHSDDPAQVPLHHQPAELNHQPELPAAEEPEKVRQARGSKELTPVETDVFNAIKAYADQGIDCRTRDLTDALPETFKPSSLPYMLDRLETKGFIERVSFGPRQTVIKLLLNADRTEYEPPVLQKEVKVTQCPPAYASGYGINNKMDVAGFKP